MRVYPLSHVSCHVVPYGDTWTPSGCHVATVDPLTHPLTGSQRPLTGSVRGTVHTRFRRFRLRRGFRNDWESVPSEDSEASRSYMAACGWWIGYCAAVNSFMDSSHSSARSIVSHNSVSSDVAVGSFVPSGTVLNAFAEEIVAYEKDSNETHAVK
ncbi:hypothetical protein Tco_1141829, partial [Tanacetum coccineum]